MKEALGKALGEAGLPLVAALPHNRLISSVRLDEICAALGTAVVSGGRGQKDLTVDKVCIACVGRDCWQQLHRACAN